MTSFFDELYNKVLTNSFGKETARQYVSYIRLFFDAVKISHPSEITNEIIEKYCASDEFQNKSQSSRNGFSASLKKVAEYYELNIRIPKRRKATTQNERIPITPEEFKTLIAGIDRNKFYNLYTTRALISFMYYTGLREGEIERLKRKDIEGQEAIVIFQRKNKSTRPIYINEKLRKLLTEYFRHEQDGHEMLFPISKRTMRHLVDKAFRLILGKKGFPHLLRHSFVTNCHQNGVDIKIIQMAVGHSTIQQTEHYLKVNPMMVVKELKDKVKGIDLIEVV